MSFDSPHILWLLFIPLVPLLYGPVRFSRRLGAWLELSGLAAASDSAEIEAALRRRFLLSNLCFSAFLAFTILALAGPRWGERLVREKRVGVDCVLAIDLSRSMLARDLPPNRLSCASAFSRELVSSLPGTRFAVALGKGSGVLALPLTEDEESTFSLLESLSSDSLTSAGTDLESLVDAARGAFSDSLSSARLIVLVSDGESLSGSLSRAVDRAVAAGTVIAAVGFGTEAGGAVPLASGKRLKKEDGSAVITTLRASGLKAAAERSGGLYLDGSDPSAVSRLDRFISGLASPSSSTGYRRESLPRFSLFLALALVCLAIGKWLESGFGRKP